MPPNAEDVPPSHATATVQQPQPQQPATQGTTTTTPPTQPADTTSQKKPKNISQTFKELMKGLPWTKKPKTQQEEDAADEHHHDDSNSPRNNDASSVATTTTTSLHHLPSIFDQLERLHQCREVVIMSGKSKKARELFDYYRTTNHTYYTCSVCVCIFV